jgi:hypothetical protein
LLTETSQNHRDSAQQSHIIEISSKSSGQRAAVATFDRRTDEDVLSQEMADILGIEIQHTEKEGRSAYPTSKPVFGQATLDWSLERNPRRVYNGMFYISTEQNPNYDVVFGTESAAKLKSSAKKARQASTRRWFR